jgi:hypothetical protein
MMTDLFPDLGKSTMKSKEIFGVVQPFLTNNLEPIWYNEGEGEKGPVFFIFPEKIIIHYIFLSLLINDLIIIAK